MLIRIIPADHSENLRLQPRKFSDARQLAMEGEDVATFPATPGMADPPTCRGLHCKRIPCPIVDWTGSAPFRRLPLHQPWRDYRIVACNFVCREWVVLKNRCGAHSSTSSSEPSVFV